MRLVDGHDVHRLLDYPSLVAALRKAHRGAMPDAGELYMGEPGAPDGGRGLIMLPAWSRGEMLGAKLVSIFPGNPQATPPHPANQGLYVAFDGVTGAPALVADGTALPFETVLDYPAVSHSREPVSYPDPNEPSPLMETNFDCKLQPQAVLIFAVVVFCSCSFLCASPRRRRRRRADCLPSGCQRCRHGGCTPCARPLSVKALQWPNRLRRSLSLRR